MPHPPDIHIHATPHEAAEALAREVSRLSADAIAERSRFTIALAGGSTPAALYRLLALPPYVAEIDWPRWHVLWGDERCVPPDHPDSNYGMAKRTLIDHVPIPESHVHRMAGEAPPQQAADAYAATLAGALAPDGRLDFALLGVGDDGHTASLFPDTASLAENERSVVANWVPHLDTHRITLTLPTLNRARHVAVLATGADKADAVRRALAPNAADATPPIALVIPEDSAVVWHLTAAAAASLLHSGESRNPGEGQPDNAHSHPANDPSGQS
ncbi:MAG: 6-phosphogluconolactonase [Chloroflexi bacterium]|nr:6-phosphogluconolactonase [Chloroflexota bacterium]